MTQPSLMRELADLPELPPALPQFTHIRRAWDARLDTSVARLLPGEYYVTRHDELIFTVLGSCVSVCVRDRKLKIGGMNHFMLPQERRSGARAWAGNTARFGTVAMEHLLNEILKLGGERDNLEFKIVGGGKLLDISLDVGASNIHFVRDYLKAAGFSVSGEDLGDSCARKVYYSPTTGMLRVKRLTATVVRVVFERERDALQTRP